VSFSIKENSHLRLSFWPHTLPIYSTMSHTHTKLQNIKLWIQTVLNRQQVLQQNFKCIIHRNNALDTSYTSQSEYIVNHTCIRQTTASHWPVTAIKGKLEIQKLFKLSPNNGLNVQLDALTCQQTYTRSGHVATC
jgi:hypothetical protein